LVVGLTLLPWIPFKLTFDTRQLYHDIVGYHKLIGRLLHLTTKRPEITFVVAQPSQFLNALMDHHLQATWRVIWYLKRASRHGFFFSISSAITL